MDMIQKLFLVCLDLHVCLQVQFKCDKSQPPRCIAAMHRCDGKRDCDMGEDELDCRKFIDSFVVVVLPEPFRRMGARLNSTETQQTGHVPRSDSSVRESAL